MQAPWWWSKTETCRSDIYVYFNVNFNVFFKIKKRICWWVNSTYIKMHGTTIKIVLRSFSSVWKPQTLIRCKIIVVNFWTRFKLSFPSFYYLDWLYFNFGTLILYFNRGEKSHVISSGTSYISFRGIGCVFRINYSIIRPFYKTNIRYNVMTRQRTVFSLHLFVGSNIRIIYLISDICMTEHH